MDVATDWMGFAAELDQNLADHAGDAEREMDILREMHHAQVFRLLAQDLGGLHTLEQISDHLQNWRTSWYSVPSTCAGANCGSVIAISPASR